jgi:hypothetical protein
MIEATTTWSVTVTTSVVIIALVISLERIKKFARGRHNPEIAIFHRVPSCLPQLLSTSNNG